MPSGGLSHEQNRGCRLYLDHLLVGIEGWLDNTSLRYITCITHIKKVLAAPRNCHLVCDGYSRPRTSDMKKKKKKNIFI